MKAPYEIEQIGQHAAEAVVGNGVIDKIEVRSGLSMDDEPKYDFFFRVDPSRLSINSGRVHMLLSRHLIDALYERGDERLPFVHLFDEKDWQRWSDAEL